MNIIVLEDIGQSTGEETEPDNPNDHQDDTEDLFEVSCDTNIPVANGGDRCDSPIERLEVKLTWRYPHIVTGFHPSVFVIVCERSEEHPQASDHMSQQEENQSHEHKSFKTVSELNYFSHVFEKLASFFHNLEHSQKFGQLNQFVKSANFCQSRKAVDVA